MGQVGIGGAPTHPTTLPEAPAERKKFPLATGVLRYFPDALLAVARVSWQGNEQHNPGQPLHWDRSKSRDEEDTMLRHFMQSGTVDSDGTRHTAKMVWRALAILQKEIEGEMQTAPAPILRLGDGPIAKVSLQCEALYATKNSGSFRCGLPEGHTAPHRHGDDISWGHHRA